MPSKWSVGQRPGTGDWAVFKDGQQHGRAHANQAQAESARKNFEIDEGRVERESAAKEAAEKRKGDKK